VFKKKMMSYDKKASGSETFNMSPTMLFDSDCSSLTSCMFVDYSGSTCGSSATTQTWGSVAYASN
jgi:hypothetical protein